MQYYSFEYQFRHLIFIRYTPYTISIALNTFLWNSAFKGLVYIESYYRTNPILIANNTFIQNAAYYGAVGIFIRQMSYATLAEYFPSAESDLMCGGY